MENFSLFGRVTFAHFSMNTSSINSATNGLADQTAGFDYRVYQSTVSRGTTSATSIDLQFQADVPGYGNSTDETAKTPAQGDGSLDITGGAFITIPLQETEERIFSLNGGLGFTHRSSHFSSQIPWTVTGTYAPKKSGFLVAASFFGNTSLKTDTTVLKANTNGFLTSSGGSFITDDINPSSFILRGQIGYQVQDGPLLLAAVEQTLWGQDIPLATNLIFGFRMTFGPKSEEAVAYSKSNHGLQTYTLQAKVTKTNDRLNLIRIDKGSDDGAAVGQIFDIFTVTPDGAPGEPIARCQVKSVKTDEAALTVMEYFKENWIEEGFIAQRVVQ
jgi:hypothetical protein